MIDKGKYASHGAFIKRIPLAALAQRQKAKLAVIHPLPAHFPRNPQQQHQLDGVTLHSKTFSSKFRFQENIGQKPVSQEFIQPFLYIEKVTKKQTVEQQLAGRKAVQPFVTSSSLRPRKGKQQDADRPPSELPSGFKNLYDYEEERRRTAKKLFQKMLEADIRSLKDVFLLWSGKAKKHNPEIDIKESEFVDFVKEILATKVSQKQAQHFFQLYGNKAAKGKEKEEQLRTISIKALAYNYEKYRKAQTEVANVLSLKYLKERYAWAKDYLADFDSSYRDLKQAMSSIKSYEESLKQHFRQLYAAYRNPYEAHINQLSKQLQKPIIKYDKLKKAELTAKVQQLTAKAQQQHAQLTHHFHLFLDAYEQAILPNHDLFFTKRTVCKLLLPLLQSYPTLSRAMIEQQVEKEQLKKEQYLECLSDLVVEIERDKKHLAEDCFTLDEVVQVILMRNKAESLQENAQFRLYSVKKLIKEIKKQFLLKYQLAVEDFEQFPADQEISLQLLQTCFEMECTKVLLKNQIWSELLGLVPSQNQQSKLHQPTIDANVCLEFVRRYFSRLDERMGLELNKSKQISLMAENVGLEQLCLGAEVINGVLNRLGDYVEDEEEADVVQPLEGRRRVAFADVVDRAASRTSQNEEQAQEDQAQEEHARREQQENIVKSLLKSIFQPEARPQKAQLSQLTQQLSQLAQQQQFVQGQQAEDSLAMKTLARSFYESDPINTNSLDIRYYQKDKAKRDNEPKQTEVVRMGSSVLLSNLPHPEDIKSEDPLRVSRFLMSSIDSGVKEELRVVREKEHEGSIGEGISHNYYKDKIRLQNRPTVYDSEGKSKYSVLLPVGYYESFVAAENLPDSEKWYLRPHHVQTLTENPLSKKDNIIHTEYQSKLDKLPLKKRPDEYLIEQNVQRKTELIGSLQERIGALKKDLATAQRGTRESGAKVPTAVVNNYLSKLTQDKQDKDLEMASYEGILYDLRRKERELLNAFRSGETALQGDPEEKWWQRKDKHFNTELRKDRLLVSESLKGESKHRQYVDKLKNSEIY